MTVINPTLSLITLNLNGLNTPIKWQDGFLKNPTICYVQEDTLDLKTKRGWK